MTRLALLAASSATALALAAGAAQADTCSGEIMALQKQMEGTPTMADTGTVNPDAGPAPLTQPRATAAQPGSDKVPLPAARGGVLVQNGSNIPPPSESEPMDSDAAQAAQLNTAAGTDATGTDATGTDLTGKEAAGRSLARARALDQVGDEAACMSAVNEAKSQLSAQ